MARARPPARGPSSLYVKYPSRAPIHATRMYKKQSVAMAKEPPTTIPTTVGVKLLVESEIEKMRSLKSKVSS